MPRTPNPRLWQSHKVSHGYVASYTPMSFVDGEGVRCSLYVAGCLFACEGCYNEAAWNFRFGHPYDADLERRILDDLAHPAVQGLSLLGGEPFLNTGVCLAVVTALRERFGATKDVWCWSGYTVEELLASADPDKHALLNELDVLVDGTFQQEQRDLSLAYRGSRNQRVLDARASVAAGRAITRATGRAGATPQSAGQAGR